MFLNFFNFLINLFMAALGLHCYEWVLELRGMGATLQLQCTGFSLRWLLLSEHGLQGNGAVVSVHSLVVPQHVVLPRSRTELLLPALQDEFFITGPPRKPYFLFLIAVPTTAVTRGSIYSGYFKKKFFFFLIGLLGHCCFHTTRDNSSLGTILLSCDLWSGPQQRKWGDE